MSFDDVMQPRRTVSEEEKPAISELFTDVYDKPTKRLIQQQKELEEHLKTYGQHYPTSKYE